MMEIYLIYSSAKNIHIYIYYVVSIHIDLDSIYRHIQFRMRILSILELITEGFEHSFI